MFDELFFWKCDYCRGIKTDCRVCNGEKRIECEECRGSKERMVFSASTPYTDECKSCDGSGMGKHGSTALCRDCGGRGWKHYGSSEYKGMEKCTFCDKRGKAECYNCNATGICTDCFCRELKESRKLGFFGKMAILAFIVFILYILV